VFGINYRREIPQRGSRLVAIYISKATVPEVRNTGVVYLWYTKNSFVFIPTNCLVLKKVYRF
jgi:hypothetical protein